MYVVTQVPSGCWPTIVNLEQGGLRGYCDHRRRHLLTCVPPRSTWTNRSVSSSWHANCWPRLEEDAETATSGTWRVVSDPVASSGKYRVIISRAACACRSVPLAMQTIELAAFHRVPPGPDEIEVAVRASSVNFADVLSLVATPASRGHPPGHGFLPAYRTRSLTTRLVTMLAACRLTAAGAHSSRDARLAATPPPGLPTHCRCRPPRHATAWYGLHELARLGRRC